MRCVRVAPDEDRFRARCAGRRIALRKVAIILAVGQEAGAFAIRAFMVVIEFRQVLHDLREPETEPVALLGVVTDITYRQHCREQPGRLRAAENACANRLFEELIREPRQQHREQHRAGAHFRGRRIACHDARVCQ